MASARALAFAVTAILALALAGFSFYATLRWNLGLWFVLPGFLLAMGVRFAFGRALLERRPGARREELWEAIAYLATALALAGGMFAWMVSLVYGSAGTVEPVHQRLNHLLAALLLVLALITRWRLGRIIRRLKSRERAAQKSEPRSGR